MIRGKHTIGVGFDFRRFVEARNLSGNFLGGYGYTNNNILNNSTGCTTPSGLCGTGNEVADFLLGYYNGANTFQPGPFSDPKIAGNLNKYVFTYIAPYVQDDWKVTQPSHSEPGSALGLSLRALRTEQQDVLDR